MIRTGIVGLGRMGMSHCAIFNSQPDVDLVAICEPSAFVRRAFQQYTAFRCYEDLDTMIDSEKLDCAVITTPTKLHYPMVQTAINAGLHVFVEKPFCLNAQDGSALVELAEEKGVANQVGYHNRFIGTFRESKRLLELNAIGEVYHVAGESYGPVVLRERRETWRAKSSEGGGCLYDYASHVVNLMQFLVGRLHTVTGAKLTNVYSKDVDDAVYAMLDFGNGVSGQLSVNWSDETFRKMTTQITLLGTKGKIYVDVQELRVFLREKTIDGYERGWNQRWVTDISPAVRYFLRGEEYSAQIEYFIERIQRDDCANINSFASAQETDQAIDAIKASDAARMTE